MAETVLITGAAHGIGRASAERLLDKGYIVYGGDVDAARLATLTHSGFRAVTMDVRSDAEVRAGVARVIRDAGRIDHVFANAGYCLSGPVELLDAADVAAQLDVNVVGVGRVIAAALPHMRAARRGRIAICSSAAGHIGTPGMAWYSASKFALQGLAQGLRLEVAEFGIKVSLIEPGFIRTDIAQASVPALDTCARHPNAAPYHAQMASFRRKRVEGVAKGADPATIAKVVHRAFADRHPRRRYHPNPDARFGIYMQRIFGDWLTDRIIPFSTIR